MTLESFYRQVGGSYDEIRRRIPGDALIKRFVKTFLSDPSFGELSSAMAGGDRATAFRAAHTLKGVSANLGFESLRGASGALTELLRPEADKIPPEAAGLWEEVRCSYRNTVDAITAFFAEE